MIFSKIERLIAKRYLKTKRKESFITIVSWLSLIGITLGVAILIIVMSVMNGFKKDLINNIVGIDGHLTISRYQGGYLDNYQSYIKAIIHNKEVTHVGASITSQALISGKEYSSGGMVKALTLQDILQRKIKISNTNSSWLHKFDQGDKMVLVGKGMAQSLGVNTGDTLKLVFPKFASTAFGSMPRYITLTIAGIFNTGMFEYDSNMVIIPLSLSQLLFNTNGVQNIEIFVRNPENIDNIRNDINATIFGNLLLTTWQENNYTIISALNTERNVMFIILFLIIMVATFNIMSGLIMLVRSKTKEIAILMAMGFNNSNIQKVFFIIGLRTGLTGTIIGTILGVLFSLNIERIRELVQHILHINVFNENVYFLSKLPADVNVVEVVVVASSALLLSILASIYPAKRATKITVAKALHYE